MGEDRIVDALLLKTTLSPSKYGEAWLLLLLARSELGRPELTLLLLLQLLGLRNKLELAARKLTAAERLRRLGLLGSGCKSAVKLCKWVSSSGLLLLLLLLELGSKLLWLLLENTALQLWRGSAAECGERSLLLLLLYRLEAKLNRGGCCSTVASLLQLDGVRGGSRSAREGLLSRTGLEGLGKGSRRGTALRGSRGRSQGACRGCLPRYWSNLEGIGVELGREGLRGRTRGRDTVALLGKWLENKESACRRSGWRRPCRLR